MSGYKELKVYRRSYEMAIKMYEISTRLPKEEEYGLKSQVKRACVGVPLNIAEGYGKRMGDKELARHLMMARGSVSEMEVLLDLLKDLGYINQKERDEYASGYEEVGKMLTGLIKSVTTRV